VAPAMSPATCGLLAGTTFQLTLHSYYSPEVLTGEGCNSRSLRNAPTHTYLEYVSPKPQATKSDFPRNDTPVLKLNSVLVFPTMVFELPEDYVRRASRARFSIDTAKPPNDWSANLARLVGHAASSMDVNALSSGEWDEYIAQFDPVLAARPETLPAAQADLRRRAIRSLAEVEKKWMMAQEEKIADALLDGRFGKSFRQRRVADVNVLRNARAQSFMNAQAMMNTGMQAGLFGPPGSVNNLALLQGLHANSMAAAEMDRQLMEQVKAELGPETAVRDQIVQVEIAGLARQINADSRLKLRQQLVQLYSERFATGPK